MKYFLIILTVLPLFVAAQDCHPKKEIDPFSQQPRLSTGFIKLGSRVSVSMVADDKEIKLLFSTGEGSCFDDQSTAVISFDSSKTKSTQRNASAMNCDGIFTIVFRNGATTPTALQKVTLQKISSIILTDNTKKKIEIFLKEP